MKFIVINRLFRSEGKWEDTTVHVTAERGRVAGDGSLHFYNGRVFSKLVAVFPGGNWDAFYPRPEEGVELPYFHTPRTHQQGASFPSVEQFEPPLEMVENRPEKPLTEEEKRAVDAVLENLSQELGYFS